MDGRCVLAHLLTSEGFKGRLNALNAKEIKKVLL